MRNLIGKAAAAAILGKPVTWVSYAVQRGILSYYRIGSQIRFDPVELDDWCRRQRVPAADEYETATERADRAVGGDGDAEGQTATPSQGGVR